MKYSINILLLFLVIICSCGARNNEKKIAKKETVVYYTVRFDCQDVGAKYQLLIDDRYEVCVLMAGGSSEATFGKPLPDSDSTIKEMEYECYIDDEPVDFINGRHIWDVEPYAKGKFMPSTDSLNPTLIVFKTIFDNIKKAIIVKTNPFEM